MSLIEHYVSREEYRDRERCAEAKSEYLAGRLVPMAGDSEVHNLITGNIFVEIRGYVTIFPSSGV